MKRSRNLDQGYKFCPVHGTQYHWSLVVCPQCTRDEIDAQEAEAQEPRRAGWYSKTPLQDDIDAYGERGDGLAGNDPERCEAGGFG